LIIPVEKRTHTKFLLVEQVFSFFAVAFGAIVGKPALNTSLTGTG
jgi:hypothetical protein